MERRPFACIIFASNMADPKNGRDFDLYIINEDGTGLDRVTYHPDFDGFPMFTSDGKRLVWASNRNGKAPHENQRVHCGMGRVT